ncbi:MAG: YciI family protein [Bryobacteraceae bacterium]|jgi:hypothetical protein
MKYLLLTYLDEEKWFGLSEAEQLRIVGESLPHLQQLIASGKFLGGAPLEPTPAAATVRMSGGQKMVTDGPFAETREQVGGYTLIEAQNFDEAVAIAAGFLGRSSIATIEVRQLREMQGLPELPTHQ